MHAFALIGGGGAAAVPRQLLLLLLVLVTWSNFCECRLWPIHVCNKMLFRALGVSSVSNPSRSLKDVGAIVVAPLIIRVVAMLVLYRL